MINQNSGDHFPPQGWICPKCKTVLSPYTPTCLSCSNTNYPFTPMPKPYDAPYVRPEPIGWCESCKEQMERGQIPICYCVRQQQSTRIID